MGSAWSDLVLGGCCAGCERPGKVLCADCAAVLGSERYGGLGVLPSVRCPEPPAGVPTYAAGWYADPLRRLVLAHKERGSYLLANPLGALLADVLVLALDDLAAPPTTLIALVPVPSRPRVTRQRGHDPVLRTVRAAARLLNGTGRRTAVLPLLRYREQVVDQAGLDQAERALNLAGRLAVRGGPHRRLARAGEAVAVLLCDDVVTTGSTLAEAERALAAVGLPVAAAAALAATRRRTLR